MNLKAEIAKQLKKASGLEIDFQQMLEIPPDPELGDLALPCFALAKELKKNPAEIASELAAKIESSPLIQKIQPVGAYLNFFINKDILIGNILQRIYKEKERYGSSKIGKKKTIVIDFSSPNIAKPFSIAHLRSTVIGNSLYKIFSFLGYRCIGINHLGDWGVQFGKLIVAYKKWGSKKELAKTPISKSMVLSPRNGKQGGVQAMVEV